MLIIIKKYLKSIKEVTVFSPVTEDKFHLASLNYRIMKIAISFVFIFLLQESVGLPWHSPRLNNFGVEQYNMNQYSTAYSKIGIFPIGVTIYLCGMFSFVCYSIPCHRIVFN